ncbi:MAG: tRNA pseudouridine(55) synthase TruB [Chloroflexota bacterium]
MLVIDKPAGWTSHDVVARIRSWLGERHIGHAGTLDPAATGVLPLAVGDATKVLEFLQEASKTYLAEITLGIETDTYDGDGHVVEIKPVAVDIGAIERALMDFRGTIQQVPPMHAAVKIEGQRLYELARAGRTVDRPARQVTINSLSVVSWEPPVLTMCVDCSKGTYIRALAHDLGAKLGTGAYLSNLVRLRTGPFTLCDAWTITELLAIAREDLPALWPTVALHPDAAVIDYPALIVNADVARAWRHGQRMCHGDGDMRPARVYDEQGEWIGMGRFDAGSGCWQPVKVVGSAA